MNVGAAVGRWPTDQFLRAFVDYAATTISHSIELHKFELFLHVVMS